MLNEVCSILSKTPDVPKRLIEVVSQYVHYLSLITKRHSFNGAAQISGLHESRFCSLVNSPGAPELSQIVLNRAARRMLRKLKPINGRYVIIIDATIKARRGKKVENVRKHHSGSGFVNGHKFINFVILTPDGVIPLASIPTHTWQYCRETGLRYQKENEIVELWIRGFARSGILSDEQLQKALFLLDSGYDAKRIQRAIREIGADFVSALKSNRVVQGKQVREYFRSKRRWLPWKSIRLHVGNGGKHSRRKYSIRTATAVTLKGFGQVTVVYSKAQSRARRPIKYLAASDPGMNGRQIVEWYSRRWSIELWHKEVKQNYGFGDCHSGRFTAIASHVNFCMTAYLLQKETGKEQLRIEEYVRQEQLREIRGELTRFGCIPRLKTRINAALYDAAA
jgi:hypothetical protein